MPAPPGWGKAAIESRPGTQLAGVIFRARLMNLVTGWAEPDSMMAFSSPGTGLVQGRV
ncbi:hypothetical protein [Amycolatopsis magusensis]|uniref:hypothetical protein n=1 Tax=Amycolatopsis magusensis TaxID=882444 RepID=UPI0037A1935B